jgi:DNA-binding NarL/FixJ family response regulator
VHGACLFTMDKIDYITSRDATHTVKPADGSEMIRILIVDDQPAVRKGLRMMFAAAADLMVVGEASGCESALDLALLLSPDVILMDLAMPRRDGIATMEALHVIYPQAAIVVLSFHDDPSSQARAEDAGAAAFVAKSMPPDFLLATIRHVGRTKTNRGKENGTTSA